MNAPDPASRLQRAREHLRGYPAETLAAAEACFGAGDLEALDRLVDGVLTYHLPPNPERRPLAELPAEARLVEDIGVDSLAMVEMTFLLEELLGAKFPDDELRALRTLGDLRAAVRAKAGGA
jgi:acyl carrier protein